MKRLLPLFLISLLFTLPTLAQDITGTTLDGVNLRTEPSFGGDVMTQIPINTTVTIQGRNSNSTWLFVSANGLSGWVSPVYINWEEVQLSDIVIVDTTIETPANTTTQPETISTANSMTATALARLNVRSEPNTSGTILTTLNVNQAVTAIGRNADGAWIAINNGATQGWVSASYVNLNGDINSLSVVNNVSSISEIVASDTNETVQTPITHNGNYVITGAAPNNSTSYDVEITLHWNTTANMDLRVTGPDGYQIVPGVAPSPTGGYFQQPIGANEDCNTAEAAALEVITWDKGTAPSGLYQIQAEHVGECFPDQEANTLFWVSFKNDGPEVEFWVYFIEPGELFEFEFVRP